MWQYAKNYPFIFYPGMNLIFLKRRLYKNAFFLYKFFDTVRSIDTDRSPGVNLSVSIDLTVLLIAIAYNNGTNYMEAME